MMKATTAMRWRRGIRLYGVTICMMIGADEECMLLPLLYYREYNLQNSVTTD